MARLKLGLLGGTFDPIHLGHLIIAELARTQVGLDKVLFMPAGDPWRKFDQQVTAAEHRVTMVRLAIEGNPDFEVDEREVKREGPTYTVDTLRSLQSEMAEHDEIYFILGEDALADLPNWHDPEGLLSRAILAVVPRIGEAAAAPTGARVTRVEMPYIGISSTDIRQRVAASLSIRYLVPDKVIDHIEANGLYR